MSIAIIRLSRKGEIVIPKEIRDRLHWEAGQELIIEMTESCILLKSRPAPKKLRLEDLRGLLKYDGSSVPTETLCQPVNYQADWNEAEQFNR